MQSFNAANKSDPNQIYFLENKGQISDQFGKTREDILFGGTANNLNFFLKNDGISYQFCAPTKFTKPINQPTDNDTRAEEFSVFRVDMKWLNAFPVKIEKKALFGTTNYYLPACPNGALDVRSYSEITYKEMYPGIDLKWYAVGGKLKYDYLVNAGGDYTQIQIEIKGSSNVRIDMNGKLIISTPLGQITEDSPLVFQNGKKLKSSWILKNNIVSFLIEGIDSKFPFVIDPVIVSRAWATYYGGTQSDRAFSCKTDSNNNLVVFGETLSLNNIATTGSYQSTLSALFDTFVAKFTSTGSRVWATYYGGNQNDLPGDLSLSSNKEIFFTGNTASTSGISSIGAHQVNKAALIDAFIVKLDSAGYRQWATYYGGNNDDGSTGCSVDANGNVYALGYTYSSDLTMLNSHQGSFGGAKDVFLAKFNNSGVLQWATYYGGEGIENSGNCHISSNNEIFICGETTSTINISTSGAYQNTVAANSDLFYSIFNSLGTRLYGTYYGSEGTDWGPNIITDNLGNIYIAGVTTSTTNMSTVGTQQFNNGGGYDNCLAKFNTNNQRIWATYMGGSNDETTGFLGLNSNNDLFIAGGTKSLDSISSTNCYQTSFGGGTFDAVIAKFNGTNGTREWGTYYGNTGSDYMRSIIIDNSNNIYCAGYSSSTVSISSPGGFQTTIGGGGDGMIVKFTESSSTNINNKNIDQQSPIVYPNPNNGEFEIRLPITSQEPLQMQVIDVLGKIVILTSITDRSLIRITDINSGIYFYKIEGSRGNCYTGKIFVH